MAASTKKTCFQTFSRICHILKPRRYYSSQTNVKLLLENGKEGRSACVMGWVRSVRSHKNVAFLDINDGSCLPHLQVIADTDILNSEMEFGSCVEVHGKMAKSSYSGQKVEMHADDINIIGSCDAATYPLKQRSRATADYLRQHLHIRPRTNIFGALMRTRNHATMAVHEFYQKEGYCIVHTPLITANDCEGAGETFQVESSEHFNMDINKKKEDTWKGYFNHPAHLTVSGQLHLEIINGAFNKVYTFGPTFRADTNRTSRHHMSEFYMIEAEIAFIKKLDDIMQIMEDSIKYITKTVIDRAVDDIQLYFKNANKHDDHIQKVLDTSFHRMTYTEAIDILSNSKQIQGVITWGEDLRKEHEKYLVKHCDNVPVFITDFPTKLKPFYARHNDDGTTTAAVDLLFPNVGEVVGGTLREERYSVLKDRLDEQKLTDSYQWYLDLRKYGTAPHGGFGMGFERYLQWLLAIDNIKDTIPFPIAQRYCKL